MAKKPSITTLTSGFNSTTTLNNNFTALRNAFDNTLSLDGSTPNAMNADLDMNSNDILNVGEIDVQALTIDGVAVYPGSTQLATTYATQSYTGNGSTTIYSMGFNPGIKANVNAYIDGVHQNQDAFNISGTSLTFTAAPPLNSAIEIKVPINVTSLVNTDSSAIVYNQGGTGAVTTNVKAKLQEFVSVKDFGAVGDGVTDDTAAIQAAIAIQKPLFFPEGEYRITSALTSNQAKIYWTGERAVLKSEVLSGFMLTFGTDAISKYDLILEGLRFEKTSGTNSCIYLYEQLNAKVNYCYFSDFEDYAIHAKSCDGLDITNCRIYDGSVKVENQMDGFWFTNNEVAASVNHPCLEVYGGYGQTISGNFFSWSQQEAIVLGYDSTRGDYPNSLTIQNNYIERMCQQDTSADPRPFIYVGAPYDQDGTAYSGALRASAVSVNENYINADITNVNLAKVAPILFEYSDSCEYVNNISLNFSGTNARIQMKYPVRSLYLGAGGQVNGLAGTKTAQQQAQYRAYTAYRGNYQFYCERHEITTDGSGNGNISLTGTTTKFGTSAAKLFFNATPEKSAVVFVDNISINAGASADGSDQAAFRVQVNSGPISSTINVMIVGWVQP